MKVLICPICCSRLFKNTQGAACENRHQFDRAREGYFNLLPAQHKNSREPGDAKQQLDARRFFLRSGFFLPLVDHVVKLIPIETKTILDIGCGEGYFTQKLGDCFSSIEIYGVDIAKAGVRLAAKNTSSRFTYLVASNHHLPIATDSMDIITRIYAPSKDDELKRVLHDNGKLIIVTPGANHLLKLREMIYQTIRPYLPAETPLGFKLMDYQRVEFDLKVPAGQLSDALLSMTPFAWRLDASLKKSLSEQGIEDFADFDVRVYEKVRNKNGSSSFI